MANKPVRVQTASTDFQNGLYVEFFASRNGFFHDRMIISYTESFVFHSRFKSNASSLAIDCLDFLGGIYECVLVGIGDFRHQMRIGASAFSPHQRVISDNVCGISNASSPTACQNPDIAASFLAAF